MGRARQILVVKFGTFQNGFILHSFLAFFDVKLHENTSYGLLSVFNASETTLLVEIGIKTFEKLGVL